MVPVYDREDRTNMQRIFDNGTFTGLSQMKGMDESKTNHRLTDLVMRSHELAAELLT